MSTYLELKAQYNQLGQQVEQARLAERQPVIDDIKEKIKLYDITAKDLGFSDSSNKDIEKKSKEPKTKAPAKYRYEGNEWTGHGKRPKWFIAAIASSVTEEDMRVNE